VYESGAGGSPSFGMGIDYEVADWNGDGLVEEREKRHFAFFIDWVGRDQYSGTDKRNNMSATNTRYGLFLDAK
jgi:hypothetical protein